MVLKLYNTLNRKKEEFKPIVDGEVRMYVCGPTVNDVPHLGHARQQITFDVLRKYLIYLGYKVKFVSNITDIEDKIIIKAKELNIDINELTKKNEIAHKEDYSKINVMAPDVQPHATKYVNEMIELISLLEKKGYTYIIEGDGVYYNVSKFKDYGKLSKISLNDLKNKRKLKDESKGKEKRDEKDFVLWKFSKEGEPSWDSPWGKGRPGWHIECSAMSHKELGNPFDIHGGGQDLIFPHHEDEIAQSEAGYEKKMVNYWIHNGMVNVNNVKMSKSLGNFKTIRDLLKDYNGTIIRYFVLSNKYRQPIDFSSERLENAKNSYNRLKKLISELKNDNKINKGYLKEFEEAMNDDLNTPKSLQVIWKLVRDKKAEGKIGTIKVIDNVLSLDLLKEEFIEIPEEIKILVEKREEARKNKNWEEADRIRKEINNKGYNILDTKEGPVLEKIK
jgi:cysteinyl-tRNA synthetase